MTPRLPAPFPAGLAAVVLLLAAACAGPPVYRPPPGGSQSILAPSENPKAERAEAEGARPTLAVVTLEDARPAHHRLALSSWLEEYDGYTGEAVTRDRAYRQAVDEMASDALAEALRETGHFAEIHRVSRADRADTDLILTARLRRLRGWQAYRVEKDEPARILESIGDVFIDEVLVVEAATGRIVFIGQTGAMLEDPPADVDPYAAAQAAFDQAATALADRMAEMDLAAADLKHEVSLEAEEGGDADALLESLPPGWSGSRAVGTVPTGWSGEARCMALRLTDESRWFFHPRLGFYQPNVSLWVCPPAWQGEMRLSGDDAERFPAAVLGFDEAGGAWLRLSLGKTSWPSAEADLLRYLALEVPDEGPVFTLPAAEAGPVTPAKPLPREQIPGPGTSP